MAGEHHSFMMRDSTSGHTPCNVWVPEPLQVGWHSNVTPTAGN
jgi:hypothetical protein